MTKLSLARAIRVIVVAVLVFVIAVILWYFFSHRRPRTVFPQKNEAIPAEKVERQDGIVHLDFKGDRVIQARAERHYAGENGRYILEGNVEIRDLGKGKGDEIMLLGDRVSYDQDWTKADLEGNAKLLYQGLTVESAAFSYLKGKEILSTDKGVVFSSQKISGKAGRMTHSFRTSSLRLEDEVELLLREEKASDIPFETRGDIVTFQRKKRRGTVEGNVSFSFGKSYGGADTLSFELSTDEQYVRRFSLKGNAQATMVDEGESEPGSGPTLPAERERHLSADEIEIRVLKNTHTIRSVEARNQCRLKFFEAERGDHEVRSDRMNLTFDRRGVLRELLASDNALLQERGGDPQNGRSVSGQEILIGKRGNPWRIKAREGGEARVDSRASEVTARYLIINTIRKTMDAKGDVKVILKLRPQEGETVGYFSNDQPVFGAAQEMRYDEATDRLQLMENVRMWQSDEILFADRLTAFKKTGEITGEGHVRSSFHHLPKTEGAEEEKIEIGGERLNFLPQQNLLTYEQACWFKSKRVGLNSDRIDVRLQEKTSEIQQIEAQGKVTITEELREGRGEKALYLLEQETVVLTGSPKITDKEKGVIEGDKLTFRLGEGRIQVENKDRERSTTVIKS